VYAGKASRQLAGAKPGREIVYERARGVKNASKSF
jgi:hypothetical protein